MSEEITDPAVLLVVWARQIKNTVANVPKINVAHILTLTRSKVTDSLRSPRKVRSILEYLSNASFHAIDLTTTENVKIR